MPAYVLYSKRNPRGMGAVFGKKGGIGLMSSMRKALACLICMAVVCSMITSICSVNNASVKPLYDNARKVDCTLSFDGTAGSVSCKIQGVSGTTSIKGTLTLYCVNTVIRTWNIDASKASVSIDDDFTGVSGKWYRLTLDVDVTANGVTEPIWKTTTRQCP